MTSTNFKNSAVAKYFRNLMNFNIRILAMALIISVAAASCGGDKDENENDPDIEGFMYGVKAGTIVYSYTYWSGSPVAMPFEETHKITFDNSGKRMRLERLFSDAYDIVIYDLIAEKKYILYPEAKVYYEIPYPDYGELYIYLFLGDDYNSEWRNLPGFSKQANKTIAGKNCTVYSWTDDGQTFEWGGWNRISFWMHVYTGAPETNYSYRMEATSFNENTPPASSFEPPVDYEKITH